MEIVKGNPSLNEVIVFDKKVRHKGILKTLCFAIWLRKKRFDLALILHSTARVNLLFFLSGIPMRVGYKRGKLDFLLTKGLSYTKRLGEKHESEYSLDVLRSVGIDATASPLKVSVLPESEKKVNELLLENGVKRGERIIVIHPGASHVSKMYPQENFAKLADVLVERFRARIVLVSSAEQSDIGERVKLLMRNKPVVLCGKTSLGDLAALFKKADLFISNDSGPVHIACAVGTPLVSIFSRNQKGLSPTRWKALGDKSVFLHKDVGCVECLAHNCKKGFLCLRSVTVDEILEHAAGLLGRQGLA
ncbi:glycosyltransferase family 9 protein [Candidatus Omnitrophota bacterium]